MLSSSWPNIVDCMIISYCLLMRYYGDNVAILRHTCLDRMITHSNLIYIIPRQLLKDLFWGLFSCFWLILPIDMAIYKCLIGASHTRQWVLIKILTCVISSWAVRRVHITIYLAMLLILIGQLFVDKTSLQYCIVHRMINSPSLIEKVMVGNLESWVVQMVKIWSPQGSVR